MYGNQKTASPQANAVERNTEMLDIVRSLSMLNERISGPLNRMDAALDRISGSRPESVAKSEGNSLSGSHLNALRASISELEKRATRLEALVERLDSIG